MGIHTLPQPLQWTRLTGLTLLGRSPGLFFPVARLGSGRTTLVNKDTGLCIEAPPRSGNSFFVMGFGMANPGVRLAHHHHVPAQIHRARQLNVPAVALLRNPLHSALAKAAPGDKPFLIDTTLRRWLSFWRGIEGVAHTVVIARFEQIVSEPARVIARINDRFLSSFSLAFPDTDDVFAALEDQRMREQGAVAGKRPNPNIPSTEIKVREDRLRPVAENHPLAEPALKLYAQLEDRFDG